MKRLVRKAGCPLAQVIRWLGELRSFSSSRCLHESFVDASALPKIEHSQGPVPEGFEAANQFMQLKVDQFMLNINRSPADCCVILKDKKPGWL